MKNTEFSQRGKKDGETEEGEQETVRRKAGLCGRWKRNREKDREIESD